MLLSNWHIFRCFNTKIDRQLINQSSLFLYITKPSFKQLAQYAIEYILCVQNVKLIVKHLS